MSSSKSSGDEGAGPVARGGGWLRNTIPKNVKKGPGDIGEPVDIIANYFELKVSSTPIFHDYHVSFEPNVESIRTRKAMIDEKRSTFGEFYVYDGLRNLKMTKELTEETVLSATNAVNQVVHQIRIKYIAPIPWHSPEMMRLINCQVRRNFQHLDLTIIDRHFFDPKQKRDVPEYEVELWPGYAIEVAHHDAGILMVVDNVAQFLQKETVYKTLRQILKEDFTNFRMNAPRNIAGCTVMTTYNNRPYRVDDVDLARNPQNFQFEYRGEIKNMLEYYKEAHQIDIKDPKQPLLVVMPSPKDWRAGRTYLIYLVPELCYMVGVTNKMRQDLPLMKEIANCCKLDPTSCVQNLHELIKCVNEHPKVIENMSKWNMKFDDNLIKLKGRVLPNEKIRIGKELMRVYDQPSGDFSKEIQGTEMFQTAEIKNWSIICPDKLRHLAENFSQTLKKEAEQMQFGLHQPTVIPLEDDCIGSYLRQLEPLMNTDVDMVVCILPDMNKDRYDAIKKFCCCEAGILSQCIVAKTLMKEKILKSVCTKVAIQMASKVGAQPWGAVIPSRNIMVIGYDTYYDSFQKAKSVCGFVSSLNPDLTSYWSTAFYHQDYYELCDGIDAHVKDGLDRYLEKNKRLPDRLIIYRGDVSDTYMDAMYDIEMLRIKESLRENFQDAGIRLAFINVTKPMHTRFFANGSKPGEYVNPICGTVVDGGVTCPMRHEFYLVSQFVPESAATPTRYIIIEDETGLKIGHHQQLAFKLTHLYYNWPGTIRVPAPCQYAQKLAYLVGTHLHREPHSRLSDKLFYL